MATVSKWTPFGVALDITATAGTVKRTSATQFTVVINASWETYYSGAQTNYGMSVTSGGVTKVISTFGTKRSSGSGSFTGTYSISGNDSSTKQITVTFKNYEEDSRGNVTESATKSVSFNVNVPAWTSYIITYNANGGSGAPASQKKWKGQALTLSSTKPARTGYTFLGWAASSTATSAKYSAGGTYTADGNATLYAVWQANTYSVKYNANGGENAPSTQTKTYGKALTLHGADKNPTRANYTFLGWSKSSSATIPTYFAGGTYTDNASTTLYAVWELAYIKPSVWNIEVVRCDEHGNPSDTGRCASISFEYKAVLTPSVSVKVTGAEAPWYYDAGQMSSTEGEYYYVLNIQDDDYAPNGFSSDITYTVAITVSDSIDSTIMTRSLPGTAYTIDCLAGGKGVAFGKPAELEGVADFGYEAKFNKPVYGKALGMDKLPAIPADSDFNNYLDPGCYAVHSNAIAATCANIPVDRAGRLEVWSSTGEGVRSEQWSYLRQRFIPYNSSNAVWERELTRGEDNVWNYYDWWKSSLTPEASEKVYHNQKILWGGDLTSGMYMTEGHTAELTEAISAQPNGIVLVFSAYNGADDTNYSWQCFFVPKQLVALSTSGHTFTLNRGKYTYVGTKYLYIKDTYISGHVDNNATGTANGITYANNKFVLRYVIGV